MKKFLGKKPVMWSLIAISVLLVALYIFMLVRPVAIGMTYKGEVGDTKVSVKIKNSSELVLKIGKEETESRYIVKGREIVVIPMKMTDKEFKEGKKEVLDNWSIAKKIYLSSETSAFGVEMMDEDFVCPGTIVFAIVGGIVTAAVITFATLSTIYVVKKKKA